MTFPIFMGIFHWVLCTFAFRGEYSQEQEPNAKAVVIQGTSTPVYQRLVWVTW